MSETKDVLAVKRESQVLGRDPATRKDGGSNREMRIQAGAVTEPRGAAMGQTTLPPLSTKNQRNQAEEMTRTAWKVLTSTETEVHEPQLSESWKPPSSSCHLPARCRG